MRTYEETHPWITFRWEPRRIPYPVWLLLGEAGARITQVGACSMPPEAGQLMGRKVLVQSLDALAAMEGNTLTTDQVEHCLDGRLQLPASQAYLGQEVQNLFQAFRWTHDRLVAGDRQLTPWSIQLLNAQVLKGLPWEDGSSPGEYRTVRQPNAVAGVPVEDIGYLVERTCDWLVADRFAPEHAEERHAFGLVRAFLAQLYLLWLRPFGDGNERTAWLVTHQLLLEADVPAIVSQQLIAHIGRRRKAWWREIASAATGHGDPVPFLAFMARALNEASRELVHELQQDQDQVMFSNHLKAALQADRTANGARRSALVQTLAEQPQAVPPGRLLHLTPVLARLYARLDRKTLTRDIAHLEEVGLLVRTPSGVSAKQAPLRAFAPLRPA